MEYTRTLPDSWDLPVARSYPSTVNPIFALSPPRVHAGVYSVDDYLFRIATSESLSGKVYHLPGIQSGLRAAGAYFEHCIPGRWAKLQKTYERAVKGSRKW